MRKSNHTCFHWQFSILLCRRSSHLSVCNVRGLTNGILPAGSGSNGLKYSSTQWPTFYSTVRRISSALRIGYVRSRLGRQFLNGRSTIQMPRAQRGLWIQASSLPWKWCMRLPSLYTRRARLERQKWNDHLALAISTICAHKQRTSVWPRDGSGRALTWYGLLRRG